MKKAPETPAEGGPGDVARRAPREGDIVASRDVATDRVYRGGLLALLGFGGVLALDLLAPAAGPPVWIGLGASLTAFGAGAVWAGLGATHLVRHGRRGSALWLLSLVGFGGSLILNVATRVLMGVSGAAIFGTLNRLAMGAGVFFVAALAVLGILAVVRRLID